jgi:hypothetical protein
MLLSLLPGLGAAGATTTSSAAASSCVLKECKASVLALILIRKSGVENVE